MLILLPHHSEKAKNIIEPNHFEKLLNMNAIISQPRNIFNPKFALSNTPSASIIGGMGDSSKASTHLPGAPTFRPNTSAYQASTHLTHFLPQNLGSSLLAGTTSDLPGNLKKECTCYNSPIPREGAL
ncbi:hypothetical protein [Nitratifractor sp.]